MFNNEQKHLEFNKQLRLQFFVFEASVMFLNQYK